MPRMEEPWGVATDGSGDIFIGDEFNNRDREVSVPYSLVIKGSPNPASICSGADVILTASGGSTYTWSPSTGLSATTGSSVIAGPTITTTYTIVGKDTSNHTASVTVVVNVKPAPPLNIVPQSPSICDGQSVTLTLSGGSGYVWSPAATLNSSTGDSVIATTSVTTVYSVTGLDSVGCTATGTDTVNIISPPPLAILPPSPVLVCSGQGVTLTVPVSGSDYLWSPAASLNSSTADTVVAAPVLATTYTVTGTDSLGCTVTGTRRNRYYNRDPVSRL